MDMINLKAWCKMDKDKELKTPPYQRKQVNKYNKEVKEFRKYVWPDEFEKLTAYWKELIANRVKK